MTATEPSVREAAARAWSLIADYRAGLSPGEPGMPLGIALDMVQDTGCGRDTAFLAMRTAAADAMARHGANLPGRVVGNPHTWGTCARMLLHMIGAESADPEIVADQLRRADDCRVQLCREQTRRVIRDHETWLHRADWLGWAADAGLAILWLRQLAAECVS